MGHCDQKSYRFMKFDTSVACQSRYTKVFDSGGSFQNACGELIGVVQPRPVQRPPLSNLLWAVFDFLGICYLLTFDTRR